MLPATGATGRRGEDHDVGTEQEAVEGRTGARVRPRRRSVDARRLIGSARSRPPRGRVLGGRADGADGADAVRPRRGPDRTPQWRPTADQLELLASLTAAGVRPVRAVASLADAATRTDVRTALGRVAEWLDQGRALSATLEAVAAPTHVVALVRAGERTGDLTGALRSAGELTRRVERLGETLRRALLYPAVVLLLGVAVVVLVSVSVVPPMERTFVSLGGELPGPTLVVLRASALVRSPVTALLALAVVLSVRLHAWLRPGSSARLRVLVPGARGLDRDLQLAVVTRLVAAMLAADVPLLDAIRTASSTTPDGRVARLLSSSAAMLEAGGGVLDEGGVGDALDVAEREILRVGSSNGLEAQQWSRVAERRASALEARTDRLGAVVEPILVVLVGIVVGGAVLALYLPTFRALELL